MQPAFAYHRFDAHAYKEDCPVCYEPLNEQKEVVAHSGVGNKHPLCFNCAEMAAKVNRLCPTCRVRIIPATLNNLNEREVIRIEPQVPVAIVGPQVPEVVVEPQAPVAVGEPQLPVVRADHKFRKVLETIRKIDPLTALVAAAALAVSLSDPVVASKAMGFGAITALAAAIFANQPNKKDALSNILMISAVAIPFSALLGGITAAGGIVVGSSITCLAMQELRISQSVSAEALDAVETTTTLELFALLLTAAGVGLDTLVKNGRGAELKITAELFALLLTAAGIGLDALVKNRNRL